jgi:hypothetical protein
MGNCFYLPDIVGSNLTIALIKMDVALTELSVALSCAQLA